jgi:lipoprotein-anchoring transpeptidase ErfK/SrfK
MSLSGLLHLPRHAIFVLIPLVALALAGPAGAETKTKPPAPGGTATAQGSNPSTPKLNLDTGAAAAGTNQSQGATQSQSAAPSGATAQSGTNATQPQTKAVQPDTKATPPVADGEQANSAGKQIVVNIDKSTQEMTVFVDGVEQYTWKVSTGRPEYATPSGTYTPTSMNEMWYSKQWDNSPMPHAVFFMKDGHAIHGTHEVKNLGKPASHGCVRLAPENAAILYDLVKENGLANTQVVLSGETPGGEYKGVATARPDQYPQYPYGYRGQAVAPPWFSPNQEAQVQPDQQPRRRGLFRRWFQQNYGDQGYYAPPPAPRYYQRGYGY